MFFSTQRHALPSRRPRGSLTIIIYILCIVYMYIITKEDIPRMYVCV